MRLVSGFYHGGHPFDKLPGITAEISSKDPDELEPNDLLVIWGGEDISPELYNKPASIYSGAKHGISYRDKVEWGLMQRAKALQIPIVGVCRGAQMLCALAGGYLLQHVNNHGGRHMVETPNGYEFITNSIHHQMMYPFDVKHEMLASIKDPRATQHYDVDEQVKVTEEPEFVYFPEVKGFAIQWHPEGMDVKSPATEYVFQEIMKRV